MRYRTLSDIGDFVFGRGPAEFLVDSPEAVAQAVRTRLNLWTGEWFLDLLEGTPYETKILGKNTEGVYDDAIKERILGTTGVLRINTYISTVVARGLYVGVNIETIYGTTQIEQVF